MAVNLSPLTESTVLRQHELPFSEIAKTYRSNHIRPSVAVFFFSTFSALTKSSRVPDCAGCDASRARTFCLTIIQRGKE